MQFIILEKIIKIVLTSMLKYGKYILMNHLYFIKHFLYSETK